MAVCVAVIGKENNPLYISCAKPEQVMRYINTFKLLYHLSWQSPQELGLHYTVHTSLDVVEERLAAASTKTGAVVAGAGDSRELYLGSLCTQVRRTRTLASQLMIW